MLEKHTVEDMVNMLYSKREQATAVGITPSSWAACMNNPHWPSTIKHMKKLEQHITRDLEHLRNSTSYPEAREWAIATLKYLKTMELFTHD